MNERVLFHLVLMALNIGLLKELRETMGANLKEIYDALQLDFKATNEQVAEAIDCLDGSKFLKLKEVDISKGMQALQNIPKTTDPDLPNKDEVSTIPAVDKFLNLYRIIIFQFGSLNQGVETTKSRFTNCANALATILKISFDESSKILKDRGYEFIDPQTVKGTIKDAIKQNHLMTDGFSEDEVVEQILLDKTGSSLDDYLNV